MITQTTKSVRLPLLGIAMAISAANCTCGSQQTRPAPAPAINSNDIFDIGIPLPRIAQSPAPQLSAGNVCGSVQEDFTNPQAKSRYFYAFGQFKLAVIDNILKVRGTATDMSGFGVNTENGKNGQPFDATGCGQIEYDISGKLQGKLKLEVTDFSGKKFETEISSIPSGNHASAKLEGINGKISKIQWLAAPGTSVDIQIDNISFTNAGRSNASTVPYSDLDPLIQINPLNGRRTNGKYYKPMQELANYFLNNQGDPPNATRKTVINGVSTIAAYHDGNGGAKHLCNGGATTSETQSRFFGFMTLYAAITGNTEPAKAALSYSRFFLMPHDGAESPQLPDHLLGIGSGYPFLSHWAVDVSGNAKDRTCLDGRPGSAIFGENILFNMYDPTYNSPPYRSVSPDLKAISGKHAASFASATDADQWLADASYWAGLYGLGNPTDLLLNLRKGLTEGLNPSDAEFYPNAMRFAVYWGEDNPPSINYRGSNKQLYAGYQDPATWAILGRPAWAQNIVKFLADSQNEFKKRYGITGPFMPVFKDGKWGWEGDDPNTDWMGFQYRAFANLGQYYYLTGDQNAKKILDNFVKWVKTAKQADNGIPLEIENKGPLTGKVRRSGYAPDFLALAAQGLIFISAKDKNQGYQALAESLLDTVAKNKAANGSYYNADPNPYQSGTIGFRNAEVGISYGWHTILFN